jgi:Asp/Glu/hydantoin racemase
MTLPATAGDTPTMHPRIFLIHATPLSLAPIAEAFSRLWPEAQLANLLEDSLSRDRQRDGRLTEAMTNRFLTLARYAESAGANAILFTCSAFGPAIEACRARSAIPMLKPNEAMLEEALALGADIGLIASFPPSLPALEEELRDAAREAGKTITVHSALAAGAMEALAAGDAATHDRIIAAAANSLSNCDVVCFAQFSMSGAAKAAAAASGRRVLTTPDSAVAKLRRVLGQ